MQIKTLKSQSAQTRDYPELRVQNDAHLKYHSYQLCLSLEDPIGDM